MISNLSDVCRFFGKKNWRFPKKQCCENFGKFCSVLSKKCYELKKPMGGGVQKS
jgi:hypothetical protein